MFTGTIASNIAYGVPEATREQIEAAAREANCEFVWGMPKGFDTESSSLSYHGYNLCILTAVLLSVQSVDLVYQAVRGTSRTTDITDYDYGR
jgi:ABC-type protease/lipase transport system fused ATPase/permease subunit